MPTFMGIFGLLLDLIIAKLVFTAKDFSVTIRG